MRIAISRSCRVFSVCLALLGPALGFAPSLAAGETKPHLVIFLSDDHSYADSSAAGADEFRTPNLHRLAKDGITLTHAFAASPSCAPSRAALLTGLMPVRNGAMLNHQPARDDIKKLPAYLRELGYEVVAFGKVAHYKHGAKYGFDHVSHDGFHDDQCIPAAIEFLNKRASDQPLCLMVGTNWPHVPWPQAAADGHAGDFTPPATNVDTPETRQWRARYAAAVKRFDDDLGVVYDAALKNLGPNMLFMHFSDHGAQWPLGKWNLYDAGTRVPFFAVWTGVIRPASESAAMLSLVDVLPTLVEIAGGSPPSNIDGQSFAGVLTGKSGAHRERVFTTHSGDGRMNAYPIRSLRTRDWKYIRNLTPDAKHTTHIDQGVVVDGNAYWKSWVAKANSSAAAAAVVERYHRRPAEELYDLRNDPLEQRNVASPPQHADTLNRLRSQVDDWMRVQGDEGLATEKAAAAEFARASLERKPNVLFIAVDDLRPLLGCYGHEEMVTPALDRLAGQGRRFSHHYVQVPTCGASRCALLTGGYPDRPAAYNNSAFQALSRTQSDDRLTLPGLFRENGYKTISIGKITHSPDGRRTDGAHELPFSWDEVGAPHGKWADAWAAFFGYADGKTRIIRKTPVSEHADVADEGYPDGLIAEAAIQKLRELKNERFFLAVGFSKPHLPFNAPKRYWDLYDPDAIPPPLNAMPPEDVDPAISLHHSGEMRDQYTGFAQPRTVTEAEARHLRHAYRACVSYVDAQIGRVLAELEALDLDQNTVVVAWGDHGWHLGEHGIWGKHTLYDAAMRSPLIIRTPEMKSPGAAAEGLVESVDIYPTLAQWCELQPPSDLAGESFASMLKDPTAPGKPAVYGFWRNGRGHSIRTPQYRLIQWTDAADPTRVVQTELYDQERDPNETQNIAAQRLDVVQNLTARLRQTIPVLRKE